MSKNSTQKSSPGADFTLFRDRNFLLLWMAQIVSSLGDWALLIAIPVTIYDGTGSRVALSFSLVAETLPALLIGLLAGVAADRWNRRRLMIVSDLGRMLAVLLLLHVHHWNPLGAQDRWLIYGVAALISAFGSFFSPARAALVAALLPRERLLQANALSSSSIRLTQLFGPALAAVLLGWLHPRGVFVFDSVTFFVSAVCAAFVADTHVRRTAPRGIAGVWHDLREGLLCFWTGPILGRLILLLSAASFAGGIFNAQLYAFSKDILRVSGADYGYMVSAYGLGALLAVPLVAGPFKDSDPPRLIAVGFLLMAGSVFTLAQGSSVPVGAAMLFLSGVGNIVLYLPILTMFQTAAAPEIRGRVYATSATLGAFFAALSALTAAGLVSVFPHLHLIFSGVALVYLFCGLLAQPLLSQAADPAEPTPPGAAVLPAQVEP